MQKHQSKLLICLEICYILLQLLYIIFFDVADRALTVYTRARAIMRQFDEPNT